MIPREMPSIALVPLLCRPSILWGEASGTSTYENQDQSTMDANSALTTKLQRQTNVFPPLWQNNRILSWTKYPQGSEINCSPAKGNVPTTNEKSNQIASSSPCEQGIYKKGVTVHVKVSKNCNAVSLMTVGRTTVSCEYVISFPNLWKFLSSRRWGRCSRHTWLSK